MAVYAQHESVIWSCGLSLDIVLLGEGLENVFARHQRWAAAVRAAVNAWGLPIQCTDPAVYSPVLTGVITPIGIDADAVRRLIYERYDMSLGTGLGKLRGRMFRIGHLGDSNDLTLLAAIAGCEMGLKLAGVKLGGSGVQAAMEHFSAPVARAEPEGTHANAERKCRRCRPPNCTSGLDRFPKKAGRSPRTW